MISRGELKGKILRLLMKTSQYPGFYDDDRVNDAIEEALDFVAVKMFLADEGWQTKIDYITTTAGEFSINLPPHMTMIKEVRYKFADGYLPLAYDEGNGQLQADPSSGTRQYACSYRIVDNALYFNPPLAEGGTNYLMVEYMAYPKRLQSDTDFLESHFDNSMLHFVKYRAASILSTSIEKFAVPWAGQESSWYGLMEQVVVKRNQQSTPIRDFAP